VPTTFGVALHATTRFALSGGHEATPCGSCHEQKTPRLDWRKDQQTCAGCHENPHGDQFDKEMQAGGCASCHATVAWDLPNIDHDTWPLTGKHASLRCEQCHVATGAGPQSGAGVSYRGAPRDCAGCHEDLHRGQFRLSEPVRECDGCHQTGSFRTPDFDHASQTRYPLVGKHQKLECGKCHQKQSLESGEEVVLYRLPFDECRDCHRSPHGKGP
jgi:hypothetical protein